MFPENVVWTTVSEPLFNFFSKFIHERFIPILVSVTCLQSKFNRLLKDTFSFIQQACACGMLGCVYESVCMYYVPSRPVMCEALGR